MVRRKHRFSSAPLGVKTLAFLVALDGIVAILGGMGWVGGFPPLGALLVVVGLLQLVVAYGLFKREPYAYTWGMAIFAVGGVLELISGNVYGAGLSALNMYVLYHYRGIYRK